MNKMECRLCSTDAPEFFRDSREYQYFRCPECDLRFLDPARYLSAAAEEARYRTHNNDVEDLGYQKFTQPIVDLVASKKIPLDILDFGCGAGPVLQHMLRDSAHRIKLYDPYFFPDQGVLKSQYDFIAMIEVAEHLYKPGEVFGQLKEMLKPGGELAVMTSVVGEDLDFANWYYRKDPTHVCFFSLKTAYWIRERLQFANAKILSSRLLSFSL